MRSDDVAVDAVAVAKLDLDATTQRREHLREDDLLVPEWKHLREDDLLVPDRRHLREDDLLVPDRLITVLLHRCFALYTRARTSEYY